MIESPAPGRLVRLWPLVVGDELAAVSRPTVLRGSTMFVEVDTARHLARLAVLLPQILDQLDAARDVPPVKRVRFELVQHEAAR